jgi:hypothetical protein
MVGTLTSTSATARGLVFRLLRRLDFFLDVDDQGVADEAGAPVLEQRTGEGDAEDGAAAGSDRCPRLGRAVIGWCTAVGGVVVTQPASGSAASRIRRNLFMIRLDLRLTVGSAAPASHPRSVTALS